jgi:hypothetical protein
MGSQIGPVVHLFINDFEWDVRQRKEMRAEPLKQDHAWIVMKNTCYLVFLASVESSRYGSCYDFGYDISQLLAPV